jgi:hypothetical protein
VWGFFAKRRDLVIREFWTHCLHSVRASLSGNVVNAAR